MFDDEETENRRNNLTDMPLYKKATEISELVKDIVSLIDDKDEKLGDIKHDILLNAYLICAKIVNAEGGDLYDIRMENATIIRKAAHELKISIHSLRMFGFAYVEYYQMARDRIEEFRILFIEWVESFNPDNYIIDTWGLFNPYGVSLTNEDKIIRYDDPNNPIRRHHPNPHTQ